MIIRGQNIEADTRLFVYGTLCFPDVMNTLVGYDPQALPCEASGVRRYRIRGQVYPMLRMEAGGVINQMAFVYQTLRPNDWRIIDAFEDPRYQLARITTSLGSALSYISQDEAMTADGPWSSSVFEQKHLTDYLAMCRQWKAGLQNTDWLSQG